VPRPGLSNLSRPAILALAMLVSSPLGTRPAQAAGCHVPERPVLGMRYSSQEGARLQAWDLTEIRRFPPSLTQLPCPGEIPHSPIVVNASVLAACLATADVEPPLDSELAPIGDDAEAIPPRPFRLDRPPRGE
jgi:hypothetical protein